MPRSDIFSSTFWRNYWISIRRSRRDRRDLKAALTMTVSLFAFVGYYGLFLWNARAAFDRGTVAIVLFMVSIGIVSAVLVWTSNRFEKRRADREAQSEVDQSLRNGLAVDGFFVAVLLVRAGSEQMLKEKELPKEVSVITRSFQIDKLKKLGKWDALPVGARSLLLLPDGHWTPEQISSTRSCFETLRCIRWALCIDRDLEPLQNLPKMDYAASQEIFDSPETILSGRRLLPIWDLRVERNYADNFCSRCVAEAIGRDLITVANGESAEWASEVNETMRQPHIRDLLAGVNTISELDNSTLMYMLSLSFHRHQCLQVLMDLQDGKDIWTEWHRLCFPRLGAEEQIETEPAAPESTIL